MAEITHREAFEAALSGLRFDEAEALADQEAAESGEWKERLQQERERAQDTAQRLYQEIIRRGTSDDHAGVAELAAREDADALLALLPEPDHRRVQVHLTVARRWAESRRRRNAERLTQARSALDGFDLELARGLIANLDDRFLDEESVEERDRLLLDIEARRMELAPLREAQRRLKPAEPDDPPWWQRLRRGR